MGIEEKLPSGILLTTVEKVAGYARKSSVWPATFGLACCAIELFQAGGPRHDLARFGMERASATPRQADLMIVAGGGGPEKGAGGRGGFVHRSRPQRGLFTGGGGARRGAVQKHYHA